MQSSLVTRLCVPVSTQKTLDYWLTNDFHNQLFGNNVLIDVVLNLHRKEDGQLVMPVSQLCFVNVYSAYVFDDLKHFLLIKHLRIQAHLLALSLRQHIDFFHQIVES